MEIKKKFQIVISANIDEKIITKEFELEIPVNFVERFVEKFLSDVQDHFDEVILISPTSEDDY